MSDCETPPGWPPFQYPQARRAEQADDFFGRTIADPYRWLEDPDSAETRAWIEAENHLTFRFLATVPGRGAIRARLGELWDYERFGAPSREGPYYVYARNSGLQNQAVIYKASSLEGTPEVLLDPNTLSEKGTVALGGMSFSDDGRYMVYALAASGSDWLEWRVREVATGKDYPDLVRWSKFSGAAWMKDGSGFFYSRYDPPKPGEQLQAVNKNQKLFFHAVGTPQEQDRVVYERPDHPDWGFAAEVSEDGRFLVVVQTEGTDNRNRVFVRDLADPGGAISPFLDAFDASYSVVGNDADLFYVRTNNGAPRYRLVAIDRRHPEPSAWKDTDPAGRRPRRPRGGRMVHDQFVTTWLTDAHSALRVHALDGTFLREIPLPVLGAVVELTGRREHREAFYAFTSFTYPTTIYRHDMIAGTSEVWRKPEVAFDPAPYVTAQVFYTSQGRHAGADVHDAPQGHAARRLEPHLPVRLRRLRRPR